MKLLYIASIDFYTKPNPSYHLMKSMIIDCLDNGIDVDYIGCEEDGLEVHIPKEVELKENFHSHLIPVPHVQKSNFIKRFFEGIRYSKNIIKYLKSNKKEVKTVFVQSSPTVVFTILLLKRAFKNCKVIYNVQDMFPGSSIASGVMKNRVMQLFFFRLQRIAYSKSDVIVAISNDMKSKLLNQGVKDDKIRVIVNWFDDTELHEVDWEDNRFVKKYEMNENIFYVQYAGTMGYVFDYNIVLNVAEILKNNNKIIFQMIGEGSQKEIFMNEAKKRKLRNIVFYPLESQEMVSDVYSACSICFIPLKKGIIGNSVPSKAGLLMACHRPILTTVDKESDYYNMINDNKIGFSFSAEDVEKIADKIVTLSNDKMLCKQYGNNGYDFGHIEYSRTENMKKYIKLFREVNSLK